MDTRSIAKVLKTLTKGKRLDAHITEYVFQHNVCRGRLKEKASYGWIQIRNSKAKRLSPESYDFYLYVPSGQEIPATAYSLAKLKHYPIYIVRSEIPSSYTDEFHLHISRLNEDGRLVDLVEDARKLSAIINSRKPKPSQLNMNVDEHFSECLKAMPKSEREKLLFNRLLMDVAFHDKYPKDIDAIDEHKNGLCFYEFKRKRPANRLIPINRELKIQDVVTQAREITQKLKQVSGYAEMQKLFAQHLNTQVLANTPVYGLDYGSHVQNLIFCEHHKIRYCYVIWARKYEALPELIDSKNLKPKGSFNIIRCILRSQNIDGITLTPSKENGDLGDQQKRPPRVQLTIKAEKFSPIKKVEKTV